MFSAVWVSESIFAYLASFSASSFFISSEYSSTRSRAFFNSSVNWKGLPSLSEICLRSFSSRLMLLLAASMRSLKSLPVITLSIMSSRAFRNNICLTETSFKPRTSQSYVMTRLTTVTRALFFLSTSFFMAVVTMKSIPPTLTVSLRTCSSFIGLLRICSSASLSFLLKSLMKSPITSISLYLLPFTLIVLSLAASTMLKFFSLSATRCLADLIRLFKRGF